MKKLLKSATLLLALVMLFSSFGCGFVKKSSTVINGESSKNDYESSKDKRSEEDDETALLGTYVATAVEMEGEKMQMPPETLDAQIALKKNGKATFTYEGEETAATWEINAEGIVLDDGVDALNIMVDSDGSLIMYDDEIKIYFEKQ